MCENPSWGFSPTVCFMKSYMWDAWSHPLSLLHLYWVLSKPHSPKEHMCPSLAFLRAVLQGLVFVLSVWVAGTESWRLHCLKGKKALIPQWNTAAVLAALGTITVGEQCPHLLCQLRAPEIFPLTDCGNESKLSSAWIISEMLSDFLMLALVLLTAKSLALEINIIVGWLCLSVKCLGMSQVLRLSPAVSTQCSSGVAGLRPYATNTMKLQVYFSISRPSKSVV